MIIIIIIIIIIVIITMIIITIMVIMIRTSKITIIIIVVIIVVILVIPIIVIVLTIVNWPYPSAVMPSISQPSAHASGSEQIAGDQPSPSKQCSTPPTPCAQRQFESRTRRDSFMAWQPPASVQLRHTRRGPCSGIWVPALCAAAAARSALRASAARPSCIVAAGGGARRRVRRVQNRVSRTNSETLLEPIC